MDRPGYVPQGLLSIGLDTLATGIGCVFRLASPGTPALLGFLAASTLAIHGPQTLGMAAYVGPNFAIFPLPGVLGRTRKGPDVTAFASHGQLVANTPTTITFTDPIPHVEVINRDGTAEIFWTVGTAPGPPAPTVGGADSNITPASLCSFERDDHGPTANTVILISAGTPKYSVIGSRP